ncbi:MAG: hypothetical protein Q9220_006921 [cf. Caloplaca sp. 1 TL-2023]
MSPAMSRLTHSIIFLWASCILLTSSFNLTYNEWSTPGQLGVDSHQVEERQAGIILFAAFASWGTGLLTGRYIQYRRDQAYYKPGINNFQGSACHRSGIWSANSAIEQIIPQVCNQLGAQSLRWVRENNKALANPKYVITGAGGKEFINNEGYKISITATLWDENGDRGIPFINQISCVLAMQTLLYDCRGDHLDTRGGNFFYGHDGVVGYSVDPNCISTTKKRCPGPG